MRWLAELRASLSTVAAAGTRPRVLLTDVALLPQLEKERFFADFDWMCVSFEDSPLTRKPNVKPAYVDLLDSGAVAEAVSRNHAVIHTVGRLWGENSLRELLELEIKSAVHVLQALREFKSEGIFLKYPVRGEGIEITHDAVTRFVSMHSKEFGVRARTLDYESHEDKIDEKPRPSLSHGR